MIRARVAGLTLGVLGAGLAALAAGCAGLYGSGSGRIGLATQSGARPHADYFCADCHGVLYFDPYYDLCLSNGYVFEWRRRPEVVATYRSSYVRIRKTYPEAGRYRYPTRYREQVRARFADDDGRLPSYRKGDPRGAPEGKRKSRSSAKKPRGKPGEKGSSREKDEDERGNNRRSSAPRGR